MGANIHVVDALGLPIRFILVRGQQDDVAPAGALIRALNGRQVLANRACDAEIAVIAKLYGKPAANLLGFIYLAIIVAWIR